MGVSANPGPSDGRKPVDAELNLVPFIDLLVCCICFLLITAVWWQLSTIPARHGRGGPTERAAIDKPASLTVLVADSGYTLIDGVTRQQIPKQGRRYDAEALGQALRQVRIRHHALQLTIAVDDGVPYQALVRTMDTARTHGLPDIRVSDARLRL